MAGNCVHVTKVWDVFRVNRSVFVIMTELACCGCSQSGQTVKLFLLTLLLKQQIVLRIVELRLLFWLLAKHDP